MKKYTKKQFNERTSGLRSEISIRLANLKVNEATDINDEEYAMKSQFSNYIHNILRHTGKRFSVKRLATNEGWGVLRIK